MSLRARINKLESVIPNARVSYEVIATKTDESELEALKRLKMPLEPAKDVCRWIIKVVGKKRKSKPSKHTKQLDTYLSLRANTKDKKLISDYEKRIDQLKQLLEFENQAKPKKS